MNVFNFSVRCLNTCAFILLSGVIVSGNHAHADELIPNFHKVSEGLYRGGRPRVEGLWKLKAMGVKTIVNLQGGDPESFLYGPIAAWLEPGEDPKNILKERLLAEAMKMSFWHAPLNSFDAVERHDDVLIDRTLEVMRKAQPAFIHCEHGRDRTGLLVALYRVKYEGWDAGDAYTEWSERGHGWLLLLSDELDEYFFKKAAKLQSGR